MSTAAITGAVLAGGRGRRMSAEKASLMLGGQTFARRGIDTLRAVDLAGTLVLRPGQAVPPDAGEVTILRDEVIDGGPLAGLHVLLRSISTAWALVLTCDQPLTAPPLLRVLIEQGEGEIDAVVGRPYEALEPFPGLYARDSLPQVESAMAGDGSVRALLANLAVREVSETDLRGADPSLRSYLNVNTPDDLRRAQALL